MVYFCYFGDNDVLSRLQVYLFDALSFLLFFCWNSCLWNQMLANHLLCTISFLLREYWHHHLIWIQEDLLTKMQSLSKKTHHCLVQFLTCLLCWASHSLNWSQIYNHQRICLLIWIHRSVGICFLKPRCHSQCSLHLISTWTNPIHYCSDNFFLALLDRI